MEPRERSMEPRERRARSEVAPVSPYPGGPSDAVTQLIQATIAGAMASATQQIQAQLSGMITDMRRDLGGRLEKLENRFDDMPDSYPTRREFTNLAEQHNRLQGQIERLMDYRTGDTRREYSSIMDVERRFDGAVQREYRDKAAGADAQYQALQARTIALVAVASSTGIALLDIILRLTGH